MVLNEEAVKYMGLKNPVGEIVRHRVDKNSFKSFTVIGVIKNMVMESQRVLARHSDRLR